MNLRLPHDNALWDVFVNALWDVFDKSVGHAPRCMRQKREGRGLFAAGFW